MPSTRLVALALIALAGVSSCRSIPRSDTRQGISSALQASNLPNKLGCLSSLQLWAHEQRPPKFARGELKSALFFLGDSYLTYNFAFVGIENKESKLVRQVAEGSDQVHLSAEELARLTALVSAAKRDEPPSQPSSATHQVCSVYYTHLDGYFVVYLDENPDSKRSTDATIRFMSQVAPDAP